MYRALLLTVVSVLIVPACRSRENAEASDSTADTATRAGAGTATVIRADAAAMGGGDTGMVPATAMGKMVSQMMESMEQGMRMMDTASAATIQARMPRYHQIADSTLSRMNEEVRRMNIATDSIWPAMVDSVRQDLSRMRAMTGSGMKGMMPAHLERMRFLIQMQRTMTGKTPP
jgi:hypothetical protein